jgi:hypothetical protein
MTGGVIGRKTFAVIKGASFLTATNELRPGNRRLIDATSKAPEVGFRCVR